MGRPAFSPEDFDVVDSGTFMFHNMACRAKVTTEAADEPYDGDAPLDPGSEGFDITVEVATRLGDQLFTAGATVCSHWITPGQEGYKYLDHCAENIKKEALENLLNEIRRVGRGEDLIREASRMAVARTVCERGLGLQR